jgi:hypothetical protein
MARKKSAPESDTEAEGQDDRPVVAISKRNFDTLIKRVEAAAAEVNELSSELGGVISNAVENQHLHKQAFGILRKIKRVRDDKGDAAAQELLFHLDTMLKYEGIRDQGALDLGDRPVYEDDEEADQQGLH